VRITVSSSVPKIVSPEIRQKKENKKKNVFSV